jgi:hypothetical protein
MITKKNIIDKGIYIVSMVVSYRWERGRGGGIDYNRLKSMGERYVLGYSGGGAGREGVTAVAAYLYV